MYHVKIDNDGSSSFRVKSADYEFVIDTKAHGVTPPDTLLAALGSCVGVYLRKYAEGAKLNLSKFSIDVAGELSSEKPVSFRNIEVTIDLEGAELDERRRRAMLDFVKNCPVHNTLEIGPEVKISYSGAQK